MMEASDVGAPLMPASNQPPFIVRLRRGLERKYQSWLDASVPMLVARWIVLALFVVIYCVRVYMVQGFYIVTYGLGIFLLNLFIGFLTPLGSTEEGEDGPEGPMLPVNSGDEFKPFIRRLPEFKFWYSCFKALLVGLTMTFFRFFDVPVFWPILLVYFIILLVLTMRRQIKHMMKHKYLPFDLGKRRYEGKPIRKAEDIRTK